MSNTNGNLGRSLVLPPGWHQHGHYTTISKEYPIVIKNRQGQTVAVPDGVFPPGADLATLTTQENYSEKRATVQLACCFNEEAIYSWFVAQGKAIKKRRFVGAGDAAMKDKGEKDEEHEDDKGKEDATGQGKGEEEKKQQEQKEPLLKARAMEDAEQMELGFEPLLGVQG